VQLLDDRKLKIKVFPNKAADAATSFTPGVRICERKVFSEIVFLAADHPARLPFDFTAQDLQCTGCFRPHRV